MVCNLILEKSSSVLPCGGGCPPCWRKTDQEGEEGGPLHISREEGGPSHIWWEVGGPSHNLREEDGPLRISWEEGGPPHIWREEDGPPHISWEEAGPLHIWWEEGGGRQGWRGEKETGASLNRLSPPYPTEEEGKLRPLIVAWIYIGLDSRWNEFKCWTVAFELLEYSGVKCRPFTFRDESK